MKLNFKKNPNVISPDSTSLVTPKLLHRRLIIIAVVFFLLLLAACVWLAHDIAENRRLDATSVTLRDDLTAEFGEPAQVSDFLANLDGELVEDFSIDTSTMGQFDVNFEYYNIKHKKRPSSFTVNVVDTTNPLIYGQNLYVVETGYDGNLTNLILSGDNADDQPTRKINGKYDLKKTGDYALEYIITDASGNTARHPFTLRIVKPAANSEQSTSPTPPATSSPQLPIASAIEDYKNGNTQIGIDVSSWQGNIDWPKVRAAGVEFAFIRIGYQINYGGEYIIDDTFEDNIKGATDAGLPIGVYFYSCANSVDEARHQAEWILEKVQDYPLSLGITFDWEEWNDFNRAGMSFYTLQKVADAFLETVESAGYKGMLYGSKNYLDKFWQRNTRPVWLAQYYDHPTYSREFCVWQFSDIGSVPGISGYVDLNVLYLH